MHTSTFVCFVSPTEYRAYSSRWFRNSDMILFLNNRDLFAKKIERVPITVCPEFAEYDGPNTYNECSKFIQEKFEVLIAQMLVCVVFFCISDFLQIIFAHIYSLQQIICRFHMYFVFANFLLYVLINTGVFGVFLPLGFRKNLTITPTRTRKFARM